MARMNGVGFLIALATAVWPTSSSAQAVSSGSIAGIVRDATGAVLPGVTVEASSPVLIEKTRTVVTDAEGNYKIIDLRPGTYAVTFTLPGFATYRREGIELSTGFTATTNAEMKVGSLEETLTVTGASPVVDTQNTRSQNVLSREMIDTLPTGRTYYGYATLTVGASSAVAGGGQDVGGTVGDAYGFFTIHGSSASDGDVNVDGMSINNQIGLGGGQSKLFFLNQVGIQEIVVTTGGASAEQPYSGVSVNAVPKDGGNRFSFSFFTSDTVKALQANNINDSLRQRFVTAASQVKKVYDVGGGVGGPIVKDKLWFYTAHRVWGNEIYVPGAFYPLTRGGARFAPDRSKPAFTDFYQQDHTGRFTWQASEKHKFTGQVSAQNNCACNYWIQWGIREQDATVNYKYLPIVLTQGTWSYPVTSKLLISAGMSYLYNEMTVTPNDQVRPTDIAITELTTGRQFNAFASPNLDIQNYGNGELFSQHNERFSISYVTGSHAAKFGVTTMQGRETYEHIYINESLAYQYLNGAPVSLTQYASPTTQDMRIKMALGLYAQDQWTLKRLTANLGVRFDYLNGYVPATNRPGGRFIGPVSFPQVNNLPNYKDISPRLGAAYDLFGDGKTAIKGSLGRYTMAVGTAIARSSNPANAIVNSANRTWNDQLFGAGDPRSGNFVPDCNLSDLDPNGECGAISNRAFGTVGSLLQWDPELLEGWGVRPYNWQASIGVQHELRSGFGIDVSWFRTSFGGFTVTQNTSLTRDDFDSYCITGPADARLPGGGNARVCGLYDVKPAKFGIVNNLVTKADNFGDWKQVFNGVDAQFRSRFGRGGLLQGGVSISRTVADTCFATDHPELSLPVSAVSGLVSPTNPGFCRVEPTLGAGSQLKFSGIYPLPYDVQVAATFQNLPGTARSAQFVAGNAQIAPSLGRNLSNCPPSGACPATRIVEIVPLQTIFEDRITQVDLRLTKAFRFGGARLQGMADVYNLFNAAAATGVSTRYAGSFWLFPYQIMGGRLFKFGAQINW
jgi:hypothetical protein